MCLGVNTQCSRFASMTFTSHTFILHTKRLVEMKSINKDATTRSSAFNSFLPLLGPVFYLMLLVGRGVVPRACPRLCQIKGQRLDGEATLLFIPVQPRERPNKSGGNVVTGESQRSLPTGRGKWRDSLSLNLPGYVFFSFLFFLNVTFILGSAGWLA